MREFDKKYKGKIIKKEKDEFKFKTSSPSGPKSVRIVMMTSQSIILLQIADLLFNISRY
jgi:hypothetical protein